MTNYVARSKLDAAEAEIKRLEAALRMIWRNLADETDSGREKALKLADEALNGERP